MTALDNALKATRLHSQVPKQQAQALLAEMMSNSSYAKLAKKVQDNEAQLVAKNCIVHTYTRKYICVVYGETKVMVTKNKLYAKKRVRKCKHCGQLECHRSKNLSTMRKSVKSQMESYRAHVKKKVRKLMAIEPRTPRIARAIIELTHCPLTNRPLGAGQTHVDHAIPFSKLAEFWLDEAELDLCHNKLWVKRNAIMLANWQNFHKYHAVLQLTYGKANLRKGAKI